MKILKDPYTIYRTYLSGENRISTKDANFKEIIELFKTGLEEYIDFKIIPPYGESLRDVVGNNIYSSNRISGDRYSYKIVNGELDWSLKDKTTLTIFATLLQYPDALEIKFNFKTNSVRIITDYKIDNIRLYPFANSFKITSKV